MIEMKPRHDFAKRWFLTAILALAALALPVQAEKRDLQGVYTIDAAVSDDMDAAINEGTEDMNVLIRDIARSRIAETNPRYQHIQVSLNNTTISVQYDTEKPVEIPANGQAVPWTRPDGGAEQVSGEWTGTQLTLHFRSGDGERVNTLVLDPNGTGLKLKVKLISSHFNAPINYVLAYRRQARSDDGGA